MTFDPAQATPHQGPYPPEPASRSAADRDLCAFRRWWWNEGSGMPPESGEEIETFAHRIAAIAWSNGAYVARREE